jgi:hypothetical protein
MHDRCYVINGKRWRLVYTTQGSRDGQCDHPEVSGKKIVIHHRRDKSRMLDTLIHECLHAAGWDMSEEWVDTTARDIARILWDQGWRPTEDKEAI